MISAPAPALGSAGAITPDRLRTALLALTDRATGTGNDGAATLLQSVLRHLQAGLREDD